jgi:hypothetical protein
MLISERRLGLIYFCLAGLEMAWFTTFFLLVYPPLSQSRPALVFSGLFGVQIAFMLALELLNLLELDWPFYELSVAGLIIAGTLLFVRVWLYWGMPLGNFAWLSNTLGALFEFYRELRPELVLIFASLFLWQRAANATSRDVGFFGVGLSFRLGLLLLILGGSLLGAFRGQNATPLLWPFLALGLTGVAVARTREKATGARSSGSLASLSRLGQLLVAVGVTVGGVAWLSLYYTPAGIKHTFFIVLKPLWTVLGPVLLTLFGVLLWLLQPILILLEWLLRQLAFTLDWTFLRDLSRIFTQSNPPTDVSKPPEGPLAGLPAWLWTGLRYALVILVIAIVLSFILLFLDRTRTKPGPEEGEEDNAERLTLGGATLGRGVRWLRGMAGLVGRFGLSRQLLAAISVQNIYANICRLARRRGYPRRPAQPPDDYLPVLQQAFAGQEEALARITDAYMRVHYGDQPINSLELGQLRQDYQQVRAS